MAQRKTEDNRRTRSRTQVCHFRWQTNSESHRQGCKSSKRQYCANYDCLH